jgi:xanthine dehydrogenase YagS FAD-binding subunit
MQPFEYSSPVTAQEAAGLLARQWGEADVLAGGTDLLSLMKDYVHTPRRVVNIKGVQEFAGIRKTGAGLRIGALVTLDELLANAVVRAEYPALAEAARGVASPQIRNLGTLGGDLCQRPYCWYFRLGYGLLAMENGKSLVPGGDNRYHAILGNQGPAYFVSASGFGPPLVALGARVKLVSASGTRELPIEKFFVTPQAEGEREIALRPDEILSEILVPPAGGARNATYEILQKEALDRPLASASVRVEMKGRAVARAHIVLGQVAPVPWRATAAEQALAGKPLTADAIEEASKAAVAGAAPLSMNGYKVQLARVAVRRALAEAAKGKG